MQASGREAYVLSEEHWVSVPTSLPAPSNLVGDKMEVSSDDIVVVRCSIEMFITRVGEGLGGEYSNSRTSNSLPASPAPTRPAPKEWQRKEAPWLRIQKWACSGRHHKVIPHGLLPNGA